MSEPATSLPIAEISALEVRRAAHQAIALDDPTLEAMLEELRLGSLVGESVASRRDQDTVTHTLSQILECDAVFEFYVSISPARVRAEW